MSNISPLTKVNPLATAYEQGKPTFQTKTSFLETARMPRLCHMPILESISNFLSRSLFHLPFLQRVLTPTLLHFSHGIVAG